MVTGPQMWLKSNEMDKKWVKKWKKLNAVKKRQISMKKKNSELMCYYNRAKNVCVQTQNMVLNERDYLCVIHIVYYW